MSAPSSIDFFDAQFQLQVRDADLALNPFEQATLPWLRGRVLDYGCGLGNLSVAAARRGCSVVAIDASRTAIEHLRRLAQAEALPIDAFEADLRTYALGEVFDAIACIGLLMFFDCPSARTQLAMLQSHVRPGGIAAVNVLVEGTTYLDMFDASGHCLFARDELARRFDGWEIIHASHDDFPAPRDTLKSFATVIARKPAAQPRRAEAV